MEALVSILVPAYNAELWIEATLESALNQDYPNFEVVLVNDGSTDRTLSIARRYDSARLKIIDQPNQGGTAARNAAMRAAQGEYFQWLDHDDLLASDKVSAQMKHVERDRDSKILYSGSFSTFYFNIASAKKSSSPLLRSLSPLEYFLIKFGQDEWIHTTCWLVSRQLSEIAGPWWELRSPDDDGEYFCRVVAASKGIKFVPEAHSYWRVGNDASFSVGNSAKRDGKNGQPNRTLEAFLASTFRCVDHFLDFDNSDESREACVEFLRNRLCYFYPGERDMLRRIYQRAEELGGRVSKPPLPPPYELASRVVGWRAANGTLSASRKMANYVRRNWHQLKAR